MAAMRCLGLVFSQSTKVLLRGVRCQQNNTKRFITTNESGGVLHKPEQVKFGLVKLVIVSVPFMYVGSMMSREFATWLEEHELFVPDDDDDDD